MTWSSQLLPKIVTTGVSAATSSRRFGSSVGPCWRGGGSSRTRPASRVCQRHRPGGREELDVLGVRARPAALDVRHAELVEHPRDAQLVGERQGDVLALRAVAEGRVVEDDRRSPSLAAAHAAHPGARRRRARSTTAVGEGRSCRPPRSPASLAVGGQRGRRSGSRRRAPRRRRPRWPSAAVGSARATSAAASPPTGSCRSGWRGPARRCPARSRGSARTGRSVPWAVRRSPSDADGSMPSEPARTAASSDRMSPNRFSVTMTSKTAGRRIEQHRARVDELVVERRRPGSSARDLVDDRPPQARRREHVGLVDAGQALAARPRASSKASRTIAPDLALGVRQRVDGGRAPSGVVALLRPAAEVEAAGQLADDQQVDALEQLGAERRGRRRAPGGRVTGRRLANRPRPPRSANSACSGRTARGRVVPLRPADGAEQDRVGRRGRRRRPRGGSRRRTRRSRAADEELGPLEREAERARRPRRATRRARRRRPPARRRRPGSARSGRSAVAASVTAGPRPCAAPTNATTTPLISAPWSLLTATR